MSELLVVHSPETRVSFFGIERLHPFDVRKMDKIAAMLRDRKLVAEFAAPEQVSEADLARVHDAAYLASLHDLGVLSRALLERPLPRIFPQSALERLRAPFRTAVGGTLAAARISLREGLGINLGGGFHHARPALGHGFCIYNDVAYALHALRAEGFAGRALIVDTDVHQGDGNHAFFADDPSVFSSSIHQGSLFPFPKLRGDLDIALPAGTGDGEYLQILEQMLERLFLELSPALVVHVAGADVLGDDPLGGLSLTQSGLVARDRAVLRAARARGTPLLHLLAGGYGPSAARAQGASIEALLQERP